MPIKLQEDQVLAQRPRLQEACLKLNSIAEELGAEAKLPTMIELNSALGISIQTISDAVRELEKRSILNSVRGVGIYVSPQRNRLRTGNVGFVTAANAEHDNYYWGIALAGMREAARLHDCNLLLIDNGDDFERWEKIDGALLYFSQNPYSPQLAMPQPPRTLPYLTLLNKIPGVACIHVDDFDGSYQLTKHLVDSGHRRIAYLSHGNVGLSLLDQRKGGYLAALREAGIEKNPRWMRGLSIPDEWSGSQVAYPMAGEHYTRQWLGEDWHDLGCTALVVQNDHAALGAIAAFEAAGVQVPRDVSVVGFDGLPTYHGAAQLTTAQVPLFEVGKSAMISLMNWLRDPSQTPQDICLPTRFIQGQTTAPRREH